MIRRGSAQSIIHGIGLDVNKNPKVIRFLTDL